LIRQETGFDGQRTAYAYDLNGHLLEKTEYGDDNSQLITRYERDHAGRLVRKTLPDASVVDYAYDRQGNLLSVEDGHWALAYEYDRQNRLTAEHQGWGTLRYGYDACGQLKNLCLPDNNRVTFTHDKGGHLATVELNGEVLTSHLFKSGREHQRQQGQLLSHYHYDDQNRLHAHAVTQQQNYFYQRQYDYDKSGNLTRLLDTRKGEHLYRYDPLARLTRADHSQDVQERFAHNPAGNLLMQDRPGPDIVAANRLMIQGDRHYDYDAFGNLIRERRGKGQQLVTEYRYDCQHRLISITKPNGETANYRYDPFGRRISKTVDDKTTEFFWQGDKLIAEHHAERHRSYLYEPDSFRPLALLQGFGPQATTPYHYQLDHLGTPQELTSPEGEIIWSAHYRAYGQIARLDVGKVDNPLRFQGQYFDQESGLHYNRHRYYNPDIGRYLTPDPLKLAGGINGYQYVPNPTGWVDPLGLSCKKTSCPEGPYSVIVPGGGLAAHEAAGGHLMEKHVGRTDQQLLDRLRQEPHIPAASTFHDRATAELAISKVLDNNQDKIKDFLEGNNQQIVITQPSPEPIGTSFKKNTTTPVPGKEIYLIIRRDQKMHTGYRIHTGFPNP
ncbi:RNase A-like domain-containing protein, partial [Pseudomonas sp. NBRC 111138]|uniref:RNase A-like domain-containing protein n=1 Tax=Pseudomonas sp. NBRC 111138 TaxID=1661053 RepID=UPI000AB6634B